MNEELKAILEVIRAAGEGAYMLAIVYFVKEVAKYIIVASCVFSLGFMAYKIGRTGIKTHSFGSRIADILGINIEYPSDQNRGIMAVSSMGDRINTLAEERDALRLELDAEKKKPNS